MKKMSPKKDETSKLYVIIGDHKFHYGDLVIFKAYSDDDEDERSKACKGRLFLRKDEAAEDGRVLRFHVCQNQHDGDSSADEKFGYEYSWVVKVGEDGEILSSDTDYILPAVIEKKPCSPCDVSEIFKEDLETFYIFDDDQMPENWECDVDLTKLKLELDAHP